MPHLLLNCRRCSSWVNGQLDEMSTMTASRPSAMHKLRRFGFYLEQAVHDAIHERDGRDIVQFWDNDCLRIPTYGFLELEAKDAYPRRFDLHSVSRKRSQEDLLTQALFGAGYLGSVSMLAPHRTEYFSSVTRYHDSNDNTVPYGEALDQFIRSRSVELAAFETTTSSLMSFADVVSPETSSMAVATICRLDPWAFVLMDSTVGTWTSRLRRLFEGPKLIDLSVDQLPTADETIASEYFADIHRAVIGSRDGGRERRDTRLKDLADAGALASLAILVSRSTGAGSGILPRFYTSSFRIRRLYQKQPWLRELFAFPMPSDSSRTRTGTVWRDPYYYQLRARLPALRPFGTIGRRNGGASLTDFVEVSREVNRAIVRGHEHAEDFVGSYQLPEARPLIEVLESLESLGMADVWLDRSPEHYIDYWREGLSAIRELGDRESTEASLLKELSATADSFKAQFDLYAAQYDVMLAIDRSLDVARRAMPPGGSTTAIKNLGIERWGLSLAQSELSRLANLSVEDYVRFVIGRSDLQSARRRLTASDLEIVVAVLLGVDEFQLAEKLLDLFPELSSASLRVMRFASSVRGVAYMLDEELEKSFRELREFWSQELADRPKVRDDLCLGVAYAAFHIWQKSAAAIRLEWPEDPWGAAAFSARIVLERLEKLDRDFLAFAINHVVYVEAVAGLPPSQHGGLVASLRIQAEVTGHYRFYDTLGWREFLLAAREGWETEGSCLYLRRAYDDLQLAADRVHRDQEVYDHLRAVVEVFRERCPGEFRTTVLGPKE